MSQTLWQQLTHHGFVSGNEPTVNSDAAPWYVRTMLGIAGWFGALFLLGAIFAGLDLIQKSNVASATFGVIACLVSVLIYRTPKRNDFMEQFAFAISLAGQSLLAFSLIRTLDAFGDSDVLRILAFVTICLQTVLFFVIPNYIHRMWSSLLVATALMFLMNTYGLSPLALSILLAAGVTLWLQEFNWVTLGNKLTTPAYALVLTSILLLVAQTYLYPDSSVWRDLFGVPDRTVLMTKGLFSLSTGCVLMGLVVVLLTRAGTSLFSMKGICAILLSILGAYIGMYVPGVVVGLVLVLLGFAHSNKVLVGLGLSVLVVFIFQFYYQLVLTLLQKSALLVGSGLALLILRQLMGYVWPKEALTHA